MTKPKAKLHQLGGQDVWVATIGDHPFATDREGSSAFIVEGDCAAHGQTHFVQGAAECGSEVNFCLDCCAAIHAALQGGHINPGAE